MSPSSTGISRFCSFVFWTYLSFAVILAVISILWPHFLQIIRPDFGLGIIMLLQSGQNSILKKSSLVILKFASGIWFIWQMNQREEID